MQVEASVVVSAAETVVGFAAAAASAAIEVVLAAEEVESDTKAVEALVEEVGMAAAAALVTALHPLLTHPLDPVEQALEASAAAVIKAHQADR